MEGNKDRKIEEIKRREEGIDGGRLDRLRLALWRKGWMDGRREGWREDGRGQGGSAWLVR